MIVEDLTSDKKTKNSRSPSRNHFKESSKKTLIKDSAEKGKSSDNAGLDDSTPMLRHDKSLSSHDFHEYDGKNKDDAEVDDEVGDLVDKKSRSRHSRPNKKNSGNTDASPLLPIDVKDRDIQGSIGSSSSSSDYIMHSKTPSI